MLIAVGVAVVGLFAAVVLHAVVCVVCSCVLPKLLLLVLVVLRLLLLLQQLLLQLQYLLLVLLLLELLVLLILLILLLSVQLLLYHIHIHSYHHVQSRQLWRRVAAHAERYRRRRSRKGYCCVCRLWQLCQVCGKGVFRVRVLAHAICALVCVQLAGWKNYCCAGGFVDIHIIVVFQADRRDHVCQAG
jgi:hypothetical protein